MKRNHYILSSVILLMTVITPCVKAQSTNIAGSVTDRKSGNILVGAAITVKGKVIGTTTDNEGNFSLKVNQAPPLTLVVSLVGFQPQELEVSSADASGLKIGMEEQTIQGQEIVVSGSRVEENILRSPVSIEKMDIRAVRETPSANFYDGLQNLKGVEASTQSLAFKSINTRGFNSNGNLRLVQLIDGMDNQAPGLNFSVGNIVGMSELDVESVELLPGASSALYGPNAINGILLMNSKSPFQYQGLSAYVKGGVMQPDPTSSNWHGMGDYAFRYAKAFNNRLAFKVNASYLKALDWHATDYRDQSNIGANLGNTNTNRLTNGNPAYDGINVYGDEGTNGQNLYGLGQNPGIVAFVLNPVSQLTGVPVPVLQSLLPNQNVTRTGYEERYLANYNTESIKLNASVHYRLNDKLELIGQANYGTGTTVYTGADRYSLRNFRLGQYKIELKGSNFFLRAYTTQERSGNSYISGGTGSLINEQWKSSELWFAEYVGNYLGASLLGASAAQANAVARGAADTKRFLPGTPAFEAAKEKVTNGFIGKSGPELPRGGSKFQDKTNLYHVEGMYNFSKQIKFAEIIVGASYRMYQLVSGGTLFILKPDGSEYTIQEFGGYTQISKKLLDDKLKLTGSARYDKNENFKGQVTPRISAVYTVANSHNFRVSYQTGFRIPPTQNQYIDLATGQTRLIGALQPLIDKYQFSTMPGYTLESLGAGKPVAYTFPEYKPERVLSYEIGYKGLITSRLLVDAYYYNNTYKNFDGGQILVQNPGTTDQTIFSIPSNFTKDLTSMGWAVGADYRLPGNYSLGGNVSYNVLTNGGDLGSFQAAFNTPRYRTNVTFGNRNVVKNLGFNVVWRFQDAFRWQSTFVATDLSAAGGGYIPPYHVFDAQVSYKVPSIKSIFKIGAANLANRRYVQSWGNPSIGGLYYVSITFDELLN